jgi:hypothetical protein
VPSKVTTWLASAVCLSYLVSAPILKWKCLHWRPHTWNCIKFLLLLFILNEISGIKCKGFVTLMSHHKLKCIETQFHWHNHTKCFMWYTLVLISHLIQLMSSTSVSWKIKCETYYILDESRMTKHIRICGINYVSESWNLWLYLHVYKCSCSIWILWYNMYFKTYLKSNTNYT